MILAGNVSVPRDFDLWPSDPKINGFPELVVDQVSLSQVGDPSYWILRYCVKNRRKTDRHLNAVKTPNDATIVGEGSDDKLQGQRL